MNSFIVVMRSIFVRVWLMGSLRLLLSSKLPFEFRLSGYHVTFYYCVYP